MNRIPFIVLALIALVVAVIFVAPNIVPAAAYKERLEISASEALGRRVSVGDNLSFRIFPRTVFRVDDLEIANPDGFESPYLARVGEADIGVKLFALISGIVQVDRFVLTEPEILLERTADGRVNWNLAGAGEAGASPAQAGPQGQPASSSALKELRLGDVRLVNGRARYADAGAGQRFEADAVNLSVILKSLSEPMEAKGSLRFQGAPAEIDLVVTTLADLMEGRAANLKLDATLGASSAGTDLAVTAPQEGEPSYSGPVRLEAPDLPALAALIGVELADAPGFDRLSLAGDIDGNAGALRLSNAVIGFDAIEAEGALNLDWTGARPKASGVLSTESLDLRPYMPPPAETAAEGFPAWSEAPMDFTSLRNLDADLDISTDAIFLNDMQIGESRLLLAIDSGRMTAEIPELSMYGGQGSGQLVVNARRATPSFSGNFDMGAVNAQPFSADLFKHDNLLGLGSFTFNFTASGASQAAIMASMDGGGGFDLANGALKGVNIAGIARAAAQLQQGGLNPAALAGAVAEARGPSQQTDFTEFLSNFTMENGVVTAPTISMSGPFMTMNGSGAINLPAQTIDLRLSPRATAAADGAGGRALAVPVRIGGTFSAPTVSVDAEALLRSGAQGALRDTLQGLIGGDAQPADETQEGQPEDSLEETLLNEGLNALFGRRSNRQENEPQDDQP